MRSPVWSAFGCTHLVNRSHENPGFTETVLPHVQLVISLLKHWRA